MTRCWPQLAAEAPETAADQYAFWEMHPHLLHQRAPPLRQLRHHHTHQRRPGRQRRSRPPMTQVSLQDAKSRPPVLAWAFMRPLATCPAARNREPVCQQPSGHPAMRRGLTLLPPRMGRQPKRAHEAHRPPPASKDNPRLCVRRPRQQLRLPPRRDESPLAQSHPANRLPRQEPTPFGAAFKGGAGDLPARVMEAGNLPITKEVTFA